MKSQLLNINQLVYFSDRILRTITALFFGVIVLLAVYAPITQHFNQYPAGEEFYSFFSPICHQYPTRSFWIYNLPFALCARCTSGYLGVFLSALFIKLKWKYRYRLLTGIIVLLITIVDPILQLYQIYESNNIARFLTGIAGGISVFLIIYPFTYFKGEKNEVSSVSVGITNHIS